MYVAELSALAAALCWSIGGLFSTTPARTLGTIRFNRLRLIIVFFMLLAMSVGSEGWQTLDAHSIWILLLSSIIGVFLGDGLLYACLKRLGPRRTGILFTTNAPFSVVIGYFFLDEVLPLKTIAGCVLIMIGVFLAISYGTQSTQKHSFEKIQGSIKSGILCGVLSALCQSISVIIARPIMASGVDAVAASALRVGAAALAFTLFHHLFRPKNNQQVAPLTRRLVLQTATSGLIGMALGMTFLLFALTQGAAGLVSTLSATSPIFILPVLWIVTKERPAPGAWIGAFAAVIGMACIFN